MTVSETRSTPADVPVAEPPADDKRVRLGLRDRIPRMGLREYWYPVVADGCLYLLDKVDGLVEQHQNIPLGQIDAAEKSTKRCAS